MEVIQDISTVATHFWGLWLMVFFVGVVIWVYWPSNRERFDRDAMVPFMDEEQEEGSYGRRS